MSADTRERPDDSGTLTEHQDDDLKVVVVTYRSSLDGAAVVEVETQGTTGLLRIYVNESEVYDANPETDG